MTKRLMRQLPAIIDGKQSTISGFYQDHHQEEWYTRAFEYLNERRIFIQKRFAECMRYVDVHSDNSGTFSYEFASILRDCGSVFSSVLDAMIRGSAFIIKKQTNIGDYISFLKAQDDTIYLSSVHFRSRFPDGLVLPLYSLKSSQPPRWWTAYNKVKHSEYNAYPFGNLGNVVTALASLVILETMFGRPSTDEIWTNIGSQYPEGSADMNAMTRIFLGSE